MIVIGENTKDKGAQLEALCKRILEILGYINCRTNSIGLGGEEIDLIADYTIPTISSEKSIKTICECKAYKEPVGMTQWLKFLGKIYTHEKKEKSPIYGCLIALNGVNGNVYGHFTELSKQDEQIIIISDKEVNEKVINNFHIAPLIDIVENVNYHTNKKILSTDILYYDDNFYWKILFSENEFTLLDNDGNIIENEEIVKIHKNQYKEKYISLKKELEKTEAKKSDYQKLISDMFNKGEFDLDILTDNNEFINDLISKNETILLKNNNIVVMQNEKITKEFMATIINTFLDGYIELKSIEDLFDSELFNKKGACK